jgi:protein-disulfide isomerase
LKKLTTLAAALAFILLAFTAHAQQSNPPAVNAASGAPSQTQKNIEAYLRNVYAFGPDTQMSVGPLKSTEIEGILETSIDVVIEGNKQTVKFYVSTDGKFLFRGDMSDMTKDPLAETRAQIQMNDAPSIGDKNAPVTLVEYSDFQCPVCKNLHDVLRGMLPNYAGKVRVVFKDFPLEQIHPWARTAATAGRCAYQQDPKAFWKIYDLIYDNQEVISAANAWAKMADYASQSGVNLDTFKGCMASPEPGAAVDASRENGKLLEVGSTPTVFVNGRRLVGADQKLLEQYIAYELAHQTSGKVQQKK